MTQPWKAEHEVAPAQARTLIEAQFPALAPARLEPFGAGFDNTAYRVNERFVFRFPRRQLGADCMAAELAVLPHLAPCLPLPVPDPVHVGRPDRAYPWPFAGYPLLPGRTACTAALDAAQRTRLAGPLARFLAVLHAVPAPEAATWGAPADTLGRLDPKKRVPMARSYLDQIHRLGLVADVRPLVAVVDDVERRQVARSGEDASIEAPKDGALSTVLLHGDLYARHLLVDEAGDLCGVIDWGDIHLGHPAVDLAIAHSVLPPAAYAVFRENYGPISEETWRMARFRAVYHSAVVVAYGHDVGDAHLVREGLTALGYIASAD